MQLQCYTEHILTYFTENNMEVLPATRKIANKRNSSRYSGLDTEENKATKRQKTKAVVPVDTGAANYFLNKQNGAKGVKLAMKKFANSQSIKVTPPEAAHFLGHTFQNQPFYDAIQQMENDNVEDAENFLYLSLLGRNVVLYGLGDKRPFMERFVEEFLIGEDVLSIDGDTSCTANTSERVVRALISRICTSIIPNKVLYSNAMSVVNCVRDVTDALNRHYGRPSERVSATSSFYEAALEASDPVRTTRGTTADRGDPASSSGAMGRREGMQSKLYIIVHNIGGPSLVSRESQLVLSLLGACSAVCLVATLEHLNTSLLWESDVAARFNWVYKHMPTFKHHPLHADSAFLCSSQQQRFVSGGDKGTGLKYVLASLSSKHKELFRCMCTLICEKHQKRVAAAASQKRGKDAVFLQSVPRHELLDAGIKKMVVKNSEELRKLLKEFVDHGHVTYSELAHVDQVNLQMTSEAEIRKYAAETFV